MTNKLPDTSQSPYCITKLELLSVEPVPVKIAIEPVSSPSFIFIKFGVLGLRACSDFFIRLVEPQALGLLTVSLNLGLVF